MWIHLSKEKAPSLDDPVLIVAVSTSLAQYRSLYSQARELADYVKGKLQFERIATLQSSAFPPEVIVRDDGIPTLPECHFEVSRGPKDFLLFSGDASPMDDQYEFCKFLLGYAKELGVKELYSVGARWAENPVSPESEPKLKGFSTDTQGVEKLKKSGIELLTEEPAPFFASMVVGLSPEFGIRGFKLSIDHGEPAPHSKSVASLLESLEKLTGLKVPVEELRLKQAPADPESHIGDSTIYH